MTKAELVNAVAEKAGLGKKEAGSALQAVLDAITEAMQKGETVRLVGFGNFVPTERPAGTARNPRTGETVERAASKTVKFRVGEGLKGALK
jgi:DNA-binding protein HU-beta